MPAEDSTSSTAAGDASRNNPPQTPQYLLAASVGAWPKGAGKKHSRRRGNRRQSRGHVEAVRNEGAINYKKWSLPMKPDPRVHESIRRSESFASETTGSANHLELTINGQGTTLCSNLSKVSRHHLPPGAYPILRASMGRNRCSVTLAPRSVRRDAYMQQPSPSDSNAFPRSATSHCRPTSPTKVAAVLNESA